MILVVDSEGPNQTVQADQGPRCPHMPKDTFSQGAAHVNISYPYESRGLNFEARSFPPINSCNDDTNQPCS